MLVSLLGSCHTLRKDVADVLVGLDSVVHRAQLHVVVRVGHLLLLKQELLLLLLLQHTLLQDLLKLDLDFLWEWLNWLAIFISVHTFSKLFRILNISCILQEFDNLLRR